MGSKISCPNNSFCKRFTHSLSYYNYSLITSTIIILISVSILFGSKLIIGDYSTKLLLLYSEFFPIVIHFSNTISIISICLMPELIILGIVNHSLNLNERINKFVYYGSQIFCFLIGSCLIIFIIFWYFFPQNNSEYEDDYCPRSKMGTQVEMYDKMVSKVPTYSCPKSCIFYENSSTKLYDCVESREYMDLMNYTKDDFELLENLEKNFQCSGLCREHSNLICTFFYNMSIRTNRNCSVYLKLLSIKCFYYFHLLFLFLFLGICIHCSSLPGLNSKLSKNNNSGSQATNSNSHKNNTISVIEDVCQIELVKVDQ